MLAGKHGWTGYCVATDLAGDQLIASKVQVTRHSMPKINRALTLIGGTGKYTGISGGLRVVGHNAAFKEPAEHEYVSMASDLDGYYKLP